MIHKLEPETAMGILTGLRRNSLVFFLACLAATAILLVSEAAYWGSVQKLDQVSVHRAAKRDLRSL